MGSKPLTPVHVRIASHYGQAAIDQARVPKPQPGEILAVPEETTISTATKQPAPLLAKNKTKKRKKKDGSKKEHKKKRHGDLGFAMLRNASYVNHDFPVQPSR